MSSAAGASDAETFVVGEVHEVNVPVPDPPVHQEEVENVEAATTNDNEADDVVMADAVMADANVELEPTSVPEANEATAPEANEATGWFKLHISFSHDNVISFTCVGCGSFRIFNLHLRSWRVRY